MPKTEAQKRADKTYLQRKKARGWERLWIPPELTEIVKNLLAKNKKGD